MYLNVVWSFHSKAFLQCCKQQGISNIQPIITVVQSSCMTVFVCPTIHNKSISFSLITRVYVFLITGINQTLGLSKLSVWVGLFF